MDEFLFYSIKKEVRGGGKSVAKSGVSFLNVWEHNAILYGSLRQFV